VAEACDFIRVRSNYRHEDVFPYHTLASPARARARFLEYIKPMNALRDDTDWYNEITAGCTRSICTEQSGNERAPWDWRMLLNGNADELLCEGHAIPTAGLPFGELKQRSLSNERALAADQDPDCSRVIREDLPTTDRSISDPARLWKC
jgi:hypothetical protein